MISPVFTEYQGKRFVFFSSPHSDNGCLSNWYESSFLLDSRDFQSAEQAFLYFKALSSGDEATALRVFAMDEPRYFARLNHQIRPFDARRWAEQREGAMRRIVHEKFSQNEELTEFLLATGDATIVNCSKNPLWSCGLQMTQTERLDKEHWLGHNLLGTMLMELREELRPAEPAPQPQQAAGAEPAPAQTPQPEQPATPAAEEAATQPAAGEAAAPSGKQGPAAGAQPSAEAQPDAEQADGPSEPAASGASGPDQTSELPATSPASEDAAAQSPDAHEPEPSDAAESHVSPADGQASAGAPSAGDSPATPEPTADAEETELIPNLHAAETTTVMPRLDETKRAPEPVANPVPAPVSDETDPIIARYARHDYPTADELADGSLLKHLIVSFTRDNSPAVRQALMQCLRDSVVAVTAVKVDPLVASTAPVRDDGLSDPLIMDNGTTYRPNILENDGGQRWFPTFSSVAEISSELSGRTSVIMLPMSQCVELARTHGGLAGIVVNVFTENLILPGRTCDYIAGLDSHVA